MADMDGELWSRRRFLATSALAGGGLVALHRLGPYAFAGEGEMSDGYVLRQWFGVAREEAQKALARVVARGADFGDLFFEDAVVTGLTMEDGKLLDVAYTEDSGVGLRAVKGEMQAYGYVQSFEPSELLRVAGQVAAVASLRQSGTVKAVDEPLRFADRLYGREQASVGLAAGPKVELLERADKAARGFSPLIKRVDIGLIEELRTVALLGTYGALMVDFQPMLRFNVTVVAQQGEKRQQGYAAGGGRQGLAYFDAHSPESIALEAARIAVEMLDARAAPAGEQTVVLAPGDSGVLLHEAVGHGLEADFNRKGTSKYSGMVGQKVASPLCTVVDEGLFPLGRGSIHADDEGVAAGRSVLIEKGILKGYMHDRISALHFGLAPTGNGRRQSYRFPPLPRMTNTFMEAGEHAPEEVVASVKQGIYCKTFSGGQVNISNGDFVFQVTESYLIEEGKLTAPLKDVVIIGNGPEALGKVSMVGNDLTQSDGRWTCGKSDQRVPVGVGIPTVRMDGITVGGTGA